MSPSSRALLVVVLLTAGLLPVAGPLAAQELATAILEVGPERRRGIDAIAPDVTPYWYGRYRVASAELEVFYVDAPLTGPAAWPVAPCRERALRALDAAASEPAYDGLTYYENAAGWSLLVRPAGGELPPGVTLCVFVDRFIERHLLFENLEQVTIPGRAPVFPAVIEL